MANVLGIDVGGTKVEVAQIADNAALHAVEHPTDLSDSEGLLRGIEAGVAEVREAAGAPDAIGVGVPSQVEFATGRVLASVNIPLEGVPLREELGRRFGVPVFVDNDANCAALAEAQLVPDPPAQHLVMLTLGTGVGGGIIIDGMIERGRSGLGAELGHVIVDGRAALAATEPGFPRPGSLELMCSGTGFELAATAAARANPGGALGRLLAEAGRVKGSDAVAVAHDGDEEALALFELHGRWLGLGIASVVNTFEPQYVVLGGGLSRTADLFFDAAIAEAERNALRGLSRTADLFFDAAIAEAERNALPVLWERTTVTLAKGGSDAGVIGAGVLAAQMLQMKTGDTAPKGSLS